MPDHLFSRNNIRMNLNIDKRVYEPSDDTFLLIDVLEKENLGRVLEIGTGSGIVAISCAKKGSKVTATDIDSIAIELAQSNALRNGIKNIEFKKSDLFENISGNFDTIIFNPPYLPESNIEPESVAWDGGKDGTKIISRFIKDLPHFLVGTSYFVLSSLNPISKIEKIADSVGLEIKEKSRKSFFFEEIYVYAAYFKQK